MAYNTHCFPTQHVPEWSSHRLTLGLKSQILHRKSIRPNRYYTYLYPKLLSLAVSGLQIQKKLQFYDLQLKKLGNWKCICFKNYKNMHMPLHPLLCIWLGRYSARYIETFTPSVTKRIYYILRRQNVYIGKKRK